MLSKRGDISRERDGKISKHIRSRCDGAPGAKREELAFAAGGRRKGGDDNECGMDRFILPVQED